jgi:hypothetical protein
VPIEEFPLDDLEFLAGHLTFSDCMGIPRSTEFDFRLQYHVTTVKDFLLSLYGEDFGPYLMLFPESTLEGLVNASHFVKLPDSTSVDKSKTYAHGLPLPNNLVKDAKRFIIDRALLKLGLTKQCGFSLPLNYFGIDAIIPVCLKKRNDAGEPIYTFIAIQVKASEQITFQHVCKLQSRLHFVNCPHANSHLSNEPEPGCSLCSSRAELDEIYENQIGLVVSLGEEYKRLGPATLSCATFSPNDSGMNLTSCLQSLFPSEAVTNLERLDPRGKQENTEFKLLKLESPSYSDPRITYNIDVNTRIRIYSCLWNETLHQPIQLAEANTSESMHTNQRPCQVAVENRKFKAFEGEQRLFCVASHGFHAFKHLYPENNQSKNISTAQQVLNPDWVLGDDSTVDLENMVAALLNESVLSEYNEYLLMQRSNFSPEEYKTLVVRLVDSAKNSIKTKRIR